MDRVRYPRSALAVLLAAAMLTAACGSTQQQVTAAASPSVTTISTAGAQALPPSAAVRDGGHGGRGGSANGTPAAANALPADWPSDVPVPAGDILGSTGSAGRWTVLIVAAGSAAEVRQSTMAFYTSAGFTAVSDSVLNKGQRQVTLVVENQDHSGTVTNLMIGVTTG